MIRPKSLSMPRSCVVSAVCVGVWLLGASAAPAQVVRGTVLDSETGEPVALAYVGLLEPGRELVVAALSNRDGTFSVRAPSAGSYFLYVDRSGYRTVLDGLYELGEDGVLEIAVGMRTSPVPLEPVVVNVEGRRRNLVMVGFEERRARGLGHFLVREEIERVAVENVTDALRRIPGFIVTTPAPHLVLPTGVMNPKVMVRTGMGNCSPSLYVDGHLMVPGGDARRAVRPDDFVDPASVEAIEIYASPAEIPVEYETATGCGVMLVWTR